MNKIYTKMTKERAPFFQQMTTIYEDNGHKLVMKSPLCIEAENHIKNMATNYEFFKDQGKHQLCPVIIEDKSIRFEFLKGKSFCDELLTLAKQNKREEFLDKLIQYKHIVNELSIEPNKFYQTKDFIDVFGNVNLDGKIAAKKLNIDLIFENIIDVSGNVYVIDYEWIFDFLIPYEFIYFRAVNSFYIIYSKSLENFMEKNTCFDILGIDNASRAKYEEMDKNFLSYVYGKEYNYDEILKKYKKNCIEIKKEIRSRLIRTQLYVEQGQVFSEESSHNKVIELVDPEDNMCIVTYEIPPETKSLRFDPVDDYAIIKNLVAEITTQSITKSIEILSTNANALQGKSYLFMHEDPQVVFNIPENTERITFTYELYLLNKAKDGTFLNFLRDTIQQSDVQNKYITSIERMNSYYLEIIHSLQKCLMHKVDLGDQQ